ncbi:MAG: tRNA (guanosine(46)-N7)-methyltransferase TrmB [Candidatus Magasanikbacteria bacterium RIFCSPHIGHO2_02_FULL_41_13]|uniref:tRNA (guanine-N(7)-)-methyltransferase n=1 Tax=Candidatus Magasanikbacteria bacterium RIFCSPHIGHO2_02_FULL_41_13 TaxID=1798676 RepID=A0A1F6M4E2_9BACT|nr:MAG: tRNA (guanosine(46)-N7)-methyltransferase TrmB [Candidatus Magasanikbacteria bacterium RIFCSPHIGHO2_02_FULL_41_13]
MGHKRVKLLRFAKLPDFDFVFDEKQNFSAETLKEKAAGRSVVFELACGKGDYTLGLSKLFPKNFFVGMDVKGERIWVGASKAQEHGRDNIAFVRGRIERILESIEKNFVDEIWITFPDPFPRLKQAKHRLTSPVFLERYKKILKPGGTLHLKTDDQSLFEYTLEAVQACGGTVQRAIANIYQEGMVEDILRIQTDFEQKHLQKGRKIYYISFCLN